MDNEENSTILLSKDEKDYLSNKKTITMCIDPNWEPYEKINNKNEHIGLAADFIRLIEKRIKKEFTIVPTKSWEESLKYAKEGKCEILSFLNSTSSRMKYLNFTPTIYQEPEVIVAKDEVTYLDGLASLENKTVGIVKGYRTAEFIKQNFPNISIKYISDFNQGIHLVSEGKIYATVNSLLGTVHLIRASHLIDVKIAGKTELHNDYKIGVIKSEVILHNILSKAVSSISEKEKENILANWISVKFQQGFDYDLFGKLLAGISIIILFLYLRHRTIKKLNLKLKNEMKKQLEIIVEKDRMLFEQSKFVSMGEMLENIAHQWRQPLSQINSAVLLIDDELYQNNVSNKLINDKLEEIESLTNYMSKTIDDFRNFYSNTQEKTHFNLDDVINQSIGIIEDSFKYNSIEIQKEFDKNIHFYGYSNQLQQIILILLNNAKDVLNEKSIQNPKVKINIEKTLDTYFIKISDNGEGIKTEPIEKIFEPYFTTKYKSQGTGLGLYIARKIVEELMNGAINVKNDAQGAVFTIEIKQEGDKNE